MSRGSREKKIENPNFLSLNIVSFICERKYTHSLGDSLNQKVLSSSLSLFRRVLRVRVLRSTLKRLQYLWWKKCLLFLSFPRQPGLGLYKTLNSFLQLIFEQKRGESGEKTVDAVDVYTRFRSLFRARSRNQRPRVSLLTFGY